ncbi:TraM recognition domain-containing protein [Stenotrophomonas maltophilia]|uniref:TraM recognition domain-containing protein n=1 Tax=Stenotrophomonas maltophilia TaxID=40324 RepID=UPI001CC65E63|nr:TraM recognition domain-containing protein [Stenotrophomonas maltophilia]UBB22794.1 TraM recognition domain-containing protein [Stenotrophomonas maltophilia]
MLLSLMDWTVGIGRKLFKKDDQASSTLEQIILDGNDRYENLVGRFDVSDRVKSRVLDVPPEDVDMAVQAGAVFDEKEMALVVPEELDLDQFHPWWPKVPEDLRNTQARMIITKEGRRAEGFVLGDDMALGGDSTATSLMYLAFPLIGAVQYFLGSLIGVFSYVVLLAAIPYFVALKQAEGMKEAFKGLALMVLPVLIATASAALSSALHVDAASMGQAAVDPMNTGAGMMAVAAGFAKMAGIVLLILTIPGLLLFAAFLSAASHPHRGVLGGTAERFIQMMKWMVVILALVGVGSLLPDGMGVAVAFVIAAMYALQFTEGNFVQTAARLYLQNMDNNLATQGALSKSHVKAREQQAAEALRDKTPLLKVGRASGHLNDRGHGFAPDKGTVMMLSWRDLTQGLIVYGRIGSGKSFSVLRPLARRYRESALAVGLRNELKGSAAGETVLDAKRSGGGALILDAKDGAIISDLGKDAFDIVVRAGMSVAPYEGLEPDQITKALRGATGGKVDEKSKLWSDGGDAFLFHTGIVLKAACEHEQAYRDFCIAKLEGLEHARLMMLLEREELEKRGLGLEDLEAALARVEEQMGTYAIVAEASRNWFYTPFHHAKLLAMVEQVVPTPRGGEIASARVLELVNWLGLERPDTSSTDEEREAYAAYSRDYHNRLATRSETVHPDLLRPMSQLQSSLEWALLGVPAMHKEQRQSFTLNSRGLIEKLLRGEKLRTADDIPWHSVERGEVDVSQALCGKFVGLFLPPTQFGEAGDMMQRLLKQRVMNGIRARGAHGDKWREMLPGQTDVLLMMDEAHLLLTSDDVLLFSTSRSLGLMPVIAVQGHDSLINTYGSENEADLLANTMQSVVALNHSFVTRNYLMKRLGKAQLTTFKEPTRGIDFSGGLTNFRHSVLNDPNHPYAAAYEQMLMQGAGRLSALRVDPATGRKWRVGAEDTVGQEELARDIDMPTGGKREVLPLFLEEEYPALTAARGNAIVSLCRAGVSRTDLAEMMPND